MVMLPLLSVVLGDRLRLTLMTLMVELVMVLPPGQPHPQPQPDDVGHDTGFSAGHGQPVELVPAVDFDVTQHISSSRTPPATLRAAPLHLPAHMHQATPEVVSWSIGSACAQ